MRASALFLSSVLVMLLGLSSSARQERTVTPIVNPDGESTSAP